MKLKLTVFFLSFVYITGASRALENNIYEQCFINKVKNNKTGYSYIVEKQIEKADTKLVLTNKYTEIEFKKYGLPVKMISNVEYTQTLDGKPVFLKAVLESLDEETTYNAKFLEKNKIELETKSNNDITTQIIEYQGEILFPHSVKELFKNSNLAEIKYQTIDLSSDFRLVNITAAKEGVETINVENKQIECSKYKVVADVLPNVGNYQWYDKQGHLQKEYSSILNIEQVAASKDNIFKPEEVKNVYYDNLVPVDTKIKDIKNTKQITYKITSSAQKDLDKIFLDNNKQKIIQSIDNTIYLKIKNENNIIEYEEIKPDNYLGANHFISTDRYEIQEVVDKIKKQEQDPFKIAIALEKWVFENIKADSFKSEIKPSYRTVLALKGSPTECNLVLVSLLRAAGIPARALSGFKYIETPRDAFGYYTWAEAFINDKWIRFDAPSPDFAASPVYIGFKSISLSEKKDKNIFLVDIIKSLADYKISVLNVETNLASQLDVSENKQTKLKQEFNLLDILRTGDKYITGIKKAEELADIKKEMQKEDYLNRGFWAVSKGEFSKGLEFFQKASSMYSYGDDFNNMNYAIQMASLGLFSSSQEYLNQIYDTEIWHKQIETLKKIYFPKNPLKANEESYLKALASLRFDRNEFNIKEFFSVDSFKKDEIAQLILGLNYYKNKEFKRASKAFKKASKLNKNNYTYKLKLADSLLKENKPKSTLKVVRQLESQEIADKYFEKEIKKLKYLALSKIHKKTAEKRYYLAQYYFLSNEDKKAVELLSKSLEENLHHSETYSFLGNLSFKSGNIENAISYSQKALALEDKNIEAMILQGDIAYKKGDEKEALNVYRKVLNINSSNEEALFKIAMIQKKELKDYQAIQSLEKIKAYKANDEVFYNLAEFYLTVGDKENAIENFKKALSVNPVNDKAWFRLCELYLKDKNTFIAKNYLKPLEKINPNYKYYYYMGVIEKLNENHEKAKMYFEKSIELNSNSKAKEEL